MVLKSFVLLGALGAVADEGSSTYYCNSELKWPDWPRREDRCDVKLKRVVVFGRHGARVPIPGSYAEKCWAGDVTKFTCPTRTFLGYTNSPSSGSSPGFTRIRGNHGIIPGHDCIAGSGVRMLLNNGKQIARFYKEALGIEDIPNAVHLMIRSTDVPRVIQSATAFMIGMFPTLNVSSPPLDMIIPDQASDPMVPKPSITSSQESRSSITSAASLYRDPRAMSSLYSYLLDCLTAHFCPTVPGDDKSVPQGLEPGSKMLADVFSNGTFWFNGKYGTAPKLMKLAYGPMIDVTTSFFPPQFSSLRTFSPT
ncbi:hypothetical protein FOL47_000913 [Perkinsus chesapeaki]|uniref:Lysophosphatidic acid phosphatase type 6 n=1 Tax=Perkinsus chesapeaki TaxID=330153 RepID=A0A7J6N0Z4_PERCH|nr:hypothetical protein FOL47_000913 [Perkinsus chesapeaki]